MERIVIVGPTGSGKTTLAARLSQQLELRHVDLDVLHWEPGWKGAAPDVFRARVAEALRDGHWIVAGNYGSVRDLIWPNADTLIWLDYSLPVIFWRLLRRTLKRIVTREDLWGTGNRESLRTAFFSTDSLFVWLLRSRPKQRRDYPVLLQAPEHAHVRVFRHTSPRQTAHWLRELDYPIARRSSGRS